MRNPATRPSDSPRALAGIRHETNDRRCAATQSVMLALYRRSCLTRFFLELESIRALGNFVTAAHFVFQRFELQKEAILFRVLQNELGPVLTDARLLVLLPYADSEDELNYEIRLHAKAAVYWDMRLGIGE